MTDLHHLSRVELIARILELEAETFTSARAIDGYWSQVVELVTSQPDWDEELADGPADIIAYLRRRIGTP